MKNKSQIFYIFNGLCVVVNWREILLIFGLSLCAWHAFNVWRFLHGVKMFFLCSLVVFQYCFFDAILTKTNCFLYHFFSLLINGVSRCNTLPAALQITFDEQQQLTKLSRWILSWATLSYYYPQEDINILSSWSCQTQEK